MHIYRHKKGQSILEYVVLIAVVIAAVITMGIYMKRGVMGKARESADDIGGQFNPWVTSGNYTTTFSGSVDRTITGTAGEIGVVGGGSESTTTAYTGYTQAKTGNETVSAPAANAPLFGAD